MVQVLATRAPLKAAPTRTPTPTLTPTLRTINFRSPRLTTLKTFSTFDPPSLASTKQKFIDSYPKPIPAVYNTVLQELLAQAHFQIFQRQFKYDEIYALGFASSFDQILDGYEFEGKEQIFEAFTKSVDLNPTQLREDQKMMEEWAKSTDSIVPKADGNEGQQKLAGIVQRIADGDFLYSKFFAVGIFRVLELSGAKETKSLEELVKALGVDQAKVNKDLTIYRNILSRMSAAKELMKEMLDRERKKQAEREAAKAEKEDKTKKESSGDSDGAESTEESKEATTEVQA